jgi:hypothetical protein
MLGGHGALSLLLLLALLGPAVRAQRALRQAQQPTGEEGEVLAALRTHVDGYSLIRFLLTYPLISHPASSLCHVDEHEMLRNPSQ